MRDRSVRRHLELTFLLIAVIASGGCSMRGRRSEIMLPAQMQLPKRFTSTVAVIATGDQQGYIRSADLQAAIEDAIARSGLFASVVHGGHADYRLEVDLDAMPGSGFTLTAVVGGAWRLVNQTTNRVVLDKFVRTTDTKSSSDAFNGFTRVQLAIEGATRKFIAEGLSAIAGLEL